VGVLDELRETAGFVSRVSRNDVCFLGTDMTVQGRTATSTITNRVQTRPSLTGHSRHSRRCYSITRSARSRT